MTTEKRIALVTGASRGIGAAITSTLARSGCLVFGTATTEQGAKAITERAEAESLSLHGLQLQLTDSGSMDQLLSQIHEKTGRYPDILVNNAGITRDNLLMRMKDDEWDAVIETNLSGVFKLTKRCLKPMIKARWGRIINIASVAGVMGNPGQCNYAASKAGLIGFSKSLAKEVGSRGITVNVVAPGFVETDMTSRFQGEEKTALLSAVPIGRFASASEISAAVAYFASQEAAYVTGETLNVNGGMHMA